MTKVFSQAVQYSLHVDLKKRSFFVCNILSLTAGTWNKRYFNVEEQDTVNKASMSSRFIILNPGTYDYEAGASGYEVKSNLTPFAVERFSVSKQESVPNATNAAYKYLFVFFTICSTRMCCIT